MIFAFSFLSHRTCKLHTTNLSPQPLRNNAGPCPFPFLFYPLAIQRHWTGVIFFLFWVNISRVVLFGPLVSLSNRENSLHQIPTLHGGVFAEDISFSLFVLINWIESTSLWISHKPSGFTSAFLNCTRLSTASRLSRRFEPTNKISLSSHHHVGR